MNIVNPYDVDDPQGVFFKAIKLRDELRGKVLGRIATLSLAQESNFPSISNSQKKMEVLGHVEAFSKPERWPAYNILTQEELITLQVLEYLLGKNSTELKFFEKWIKPAPVD